MRQKDVPATPFIPTNPLCQNILKQFMDETSADVSFEVTAEADGGEHL